jgi:hypothetical protein
MVATLVTPASPATTSSADAPAPSVSVLLTGQPAAAQVWQGKQRRGTLGSALRLPRSSQPLILLIKSPGFVDRQVQLVPTEDQQLEVRLSRKQGFVGSRSAHDLEY